MTNNKTTKKLVSTDQPKGILKPEKKYTDGFTRFIKAASPTKDPVTMILRCHLLAEYYMDRLLVAAMPRGDIIVEAGDRGRLMFSDKLVIVEALSKVTKPVIDSLRSLNSVRNNCTHEQDYEVTERDIDKIGRPFGLSYLQEKKKCSNDKELLYRALMMLIAGLDGQVERLIKPTKSKG